MAPCRKQRKFEQNIDSSSESDDNNINENGICDGEMEMVQVDFDVKIPDPVDFHGIKTLLHQLFLKAHINTSELSDLLIQQKNVTGVIKQAEDDDADMDIDDADDLDVNFGVFSVVNLSENRDMECLKQLHTYLLSHCKKDCTDENFQLMKTILDDKTKHVGLIISERMINIPPRIAVPLYSGLSYDLAKAVGKGEAFEFTYFVLICKILVFNENSKRETVVYTNAEEEIIAEVATMSYDFSVSGEQDTGLGGEWTSDDKEGHRKRRVLVLPASSLDTICSNLATEIGT